MDEQPPPRASSWQIAGVWISAAAMLIAAARAPSIYGYCSGEARAASPCEEAGRRVIPRG